MNLAWVLNPMAGVLIRSGETETHRGEGDVKREAEIGVMQSSERLEPPAAGRGREGFSPEPWVGAGPANTSGDTLI